MADAADAADAPPSKRQRLEAEFEAQGEEGRRKRQHLCCSMCLGPFDEPVSVKPLGNTYCKGCITAWLSENRTDPLTGTRLTVREGNIAAVLVPNLAVQQIIDAQSVPCRYAARGCEACPALGDLEAHEANCPCKPSKCARCAFVGSRLEVAAHEQACPFVVLGPVLDAQDARIRGLEGEVRDAKRRLTAEHEATQRLQARLEALEAARPAVVSPTRRRPSEDDVREAKALYDEGLRHRENNMWSEAIAAFQNCVALDANHSASAWFQLGVAYYGQNGMKHCEAQIEPYARCIALDPKHAAAHNNLGMLLKLVRKDYDGAERQYRKAIELKPTAIRYNNLGSVLKDARKDYDGAETMYRKAIELDPKHASACWNLSDLLEKQRNDIPGAIEFTEKYIQAGNPDNDGEQRLEELRKLSAETESPAPAKAAAPENSDGGHSETKD